MLHNQTPAQLQSQETEKEMGISKSLGEMFELVKELKAKVVAKNGEEKAASEVSALKKRKISEGEVEEIPAVSVQQKEVPEEKAQEEDETYLGNLEKTAKDLYKRAMADNFPKTNANSEFVKSNFGICAKFLSSYEQERLSKKFGLDLNKLKKDEEAIQGFVKNFIAIKSHFSKALKFQLATAIFDHIPLTEEEDYLQIKEIVGKSVVMNGLKNPPQSIELEEDGSPAQEKSREVEPEQEKAREEKNQEEQPKEINSKYRAPEKKESESNAHKKLIAAVKSVNNIDKESVLLRTGEHGSPKLPKYQYLLLVPNAKDRNKLVITGLFQYKASGTKEDYICQYRVFDPDNNKSDLNYTHWNPNEKNVTFWTRERQHNKQKGPSLYGLIHEYMELAAPGQNANPTSKDEDPRKILSIDVKAMQLLKGELVGLKAGSSQLQERKKQLAILNKGDNPDKLYFQVSSLLGFSKDNNKTQSPNLVEQPNQGNNTANKPANPAPQAPQQNNSSTATVFSYIPVSQKPNTQAERAATDGKTLSQRSKVGGLTVKPTSLFNESNSSPDNSPMSDSSQFDSPMDGVIFSDTGKNPGLFNSSTSKEDKAAKAWEFENKSRTGGGLNPELSWNLIEKALEKNIQIFNQKKGAAAAKDINSLNECSEINNLCQQSFASIEEIYKRIKDDIKSKGPGVNDRLTQLFNQFSARYIDNMQKFEEILKEKLEIKFYPMEDDKNKKLGDALRSMIFQINTKFTTIETWGEEIQRRGFNLVKFK